MQNIGIEISLGMKPAVTQVYNCATYFHEEILTINIFQAILFRAQNQTKGTLLPLHAFLDSTGSPVFLRMAFLSMMSLLDALSASLLSPLIFYSSICACLIVSP